MALLKKDVTSHTIYLKPANLAKVEKVQNTIESKTGVKLSFNSIINRMIEKYK